MMIARVRDLDGVLTTRFRVSLNHSFEFFSFFLSFF